MRLVLQQAWRWLTMQPARCYLTEGSENIWAWSWADAEVIAARRGLHVIGELVKEIPA